MINFDIHSMKFVAVDGYLVNAETGERIVFYECDPNKNTVCDKSICRNTHNGEDHDFGFCSKTPNPKFRKDGTKAWYAVLKNSPDGGEPYWGREYIEGV